MKLRISMNAKKIKGPYGGGNQFANALEKHLLAQGHDVFRTLEPDLDIILILIAQRELKISAYDAKAIADYLEHNPKVQIVHRVNTCDEPRGTDLGANRAILAVDRIADYTVFVSKFVQDLFEGHGWDPSKPHSVIYNGADEEIFNPNGRSDWQPGQKLKVITHHWSTNYLKGFDIYERLDQLILIEPYKDLFEFTYVGNVSMSVALNNTRVIPPLSSPDVAAELKRHHFYVTGARHEPGGNHYIEAMQCGLPILYINSGSLGEYCNGKGIEFALVNFEEKLLEMKEQFRELRQRVLEADFTASRFASLYSKLFESMAAERRTRPITVSSKLARSPIKRPLKFIQSLVKRIRKVICAFICN